MTIRKTFLVGGKNKKRRTLNDRETTVISKITYF